MKPAVSWLFAALGLGLIGLVSLFVAPLLGGAILIAAVVLGVILVVAAISRGDDVSAGDATSKPDAPHLPGPGNPSSGPQT